MPMRHVPTSGCARGHQRTVRWSPDGAPVPTAASASAHWRILQCPLENRLVPTGERTLRGTFNRLSASNRKKKTMLLLFSACLVAWLESRAGSAPEVTNELATLSFRNVDTNAGHSPSSIRSLTPAR